MEEIMKKKGFKMPAVFTILLAIIAVVSIITQFVPGVTPATFADFFMAPVNGFGDALDVSLFVLVIGGFLGVVNETGALNNGIGAVVKKLNGKEILIIPIVMFLISLGGTTYGMAEETIALYAIVTVTLLAAGFDALVAVSTILFGSTAGVMGSTVNPFVVSAALDALAGAELDIAIDPSIVIFVNGVAWLAVYALFCVFTMSYAKKVKADKTKSLLSEEDLATVNERYGEGKGETEDTEFTGKQKLVLCVFAFAFIVMIMSVLPWWSFNVTIFDGWTSILTGAQFGDWWFGDLTGWFFWLAVIVGLIYGYSDGKIVKAFVAGACDMVSVAFVIAVSRGISVVMGSTGLSDVILNAAESALAGTSGIVFIVGVYLLYIVLSFLIPSSSGLATVSMPVIGGLAARLGLPAEIVICALSGASASINAISPTSGVTMGGLEVAGVGFGTWLKYATKVVVLAILLHMAILAVAMMIYA